MIKAALKTACLALVLSTSFAQANEPVRGKFSGYQNNSMESGPNLRFFIKGNTLENSYSNQRTDPFGGSSNDWVQRFHIRSGECGNFVRHDGKKFSDCPDQSVRSELSENNHKGTRYGRVQPKQAWYEWEVGFPNGFPFGPRQRGDGYYLLGQWHNGVCPHMNFGNHGGRDGYMLHLRISHLVKGHKHGDCQPETKIPVIDMRELEGRWNKIQVFVKWRTDTSGEVRVFINGVQRIQYNGRTLVPEAAGRNHFDFGIYLAHNRHLNRVVPATLYYKNIKRTVAK